MAVWFINLNRGYIFLKDFLPYTISGLYVKWRVTPTVLCTAEYKSLVV
jgi:hypothetical protein